MHINMEKVEEKVETTSAVDVLSTIATPPSVGDMVEGPVVAIDKGAVYVDMAPFGTGIIYGREFINSRDVIKKVNIGDNVSAKVVDIDGLKSYIELSLKEARQALVWGEEIGRAHV